MRPREPSWPIELPSPFGVWTIESPLGVQPLDVDAGLEERRARARDGDVGAIRQVVLGAALERLHRAALSIAEPVRDGVDALRGHQPAATASIATSRWPAPID